MVRKLSMPFFFFFCVLELFSVEPLEEARLKDAEVDEVVLLESDEGWSWVVAEEMEVQGRMSRESVMLVLLAGSVEVDEESSGDSWFR
jgi:hypothetical protein